jgi:hypothetical protein
MPTYTFTMQGSSDLPVEDTQLDLILMELSAVLIRYNLTNIEGKREQLPE